jgi:hypothetical protein
MNPGLPRTGNPNVLRFLGAIVFGTTIGLFVAAALEVGLRYHYPEEQESTPWGLLFWGEHWALRVAASSVATIVAGYTTGLVARKHGKILAVISSLPSALFWLALTIGSWNGSFPYLKNALPFHVSIGNKLAASLVVVTMLPLAAWAGGLGEHEGQVRGPSFDSRRYSLLGIKWYHYFWLPLLAYLWLIQASWAVFDGLGWLAKSWKSGIGIISIVPGAFAFMIFGTIYIMSNGATKAYAVLSGIQAIPGAGKRALLVLKYGLGSLALAAILQTGIALLDFGLHKLFH